MSPLQFQSKMSTQNLKKTSRHRKISVSVNLMMRQNLVAKSARRRPMMTVRRHYLKGTDATRHKSKDLYPNRRAMTKMKMHLTKNNLMTAIWTKKNATFSDLYCVTFWVEQRKPICWTPKTATVNQMIYLIPSSEVPPIISLATTDHPDSATDSAELHEIKNLD